MPDQVWLRLILSETTDVAVTAPIPKGIIQLQLGETPNFMNAYQETEPAK